MKKKFLTYFPILILILFLFFIFKYNKIVINSILFGLNISLKNVIPTLIPIFIISDLLINYNFVEILGKILKRPFNKLFGVSENAVFVIILSLISGCPSNAKYINDLLNSNKISLKEAQRLLCFTHFSNPLFIIGTIGILLNNTKIAYIILFSHYIINIIIGISLYKFNPIKETKENIDITITYNRKNHNFGQKLTDSIKKCTNTCLLIIGVIVIFTTISEIIVNIFNFNIYTKTLICGVIEITKGIKYITILDIPLNYKAAFITSLLSFGGLSIHMQVKSILNEYKINYFNYFKSRIIHAVLSLLLTLILYDIIV